MNYKGDVRSCLFLSESKRFGNVRSDDWGNIFEQDEMSLFHAAPRPGSEEAEPYCGDCKYKPTCIGCFAHAFKVSETHYPGCPWRKQYFGDMQLTAPTEPAASSSPLLQIVS